MKQYLLTLATLATLLFSAATSEVECWEDDVCCDNEPYFSGFYVGGNLGWSTQQSTRRAQYEHQNTSFLGGGQLGYDWQYCHSVFGLVWDFDCASTSHKVRNISAGPFATIRTLNDWFTTFRGRAGIAVCDTLVYVTTGAVAANFETSAQLRDGPKIYRTDTRWGWIGGVGLEYQTEDFLTFGGDLTYSHFATYGRDHSAQGLGFANSDGIWAARILCNYRFDDLCCSW